MSNARKQLIDRLNIFSKCIADAVTVDGLPAEHEKNAIAGLFRNGLAIMGYAIVEAFIRERIAEVLKSFDPAALSFQDLSDELQKAVTLGAMNGLRFRLKYQDPNNKVTWSLQELSLIAHAKHNISALSPLSFGNDASNIAEEDISQILKAFGVENAWGAIDAIAKRIGLGGSLDCKQAFVGLKNRRHSAAHDVTSNVPYLDLMETQKIALSICVPFDLLLSHSLSLYNAKHPTHRTNKIKETDISLRVVTPHKKGGFKEQVETKSTRSLRTVKTHPTERAAEQSAFSKAKTHREHVLVVGNNGMPLRWKSW